MQPSFLICGIEHSGTTLLSDIFRQSPDYDSGFEVGVLLSETPRQFRSAEPFIGNLKSGWKISEDDLDYVCDCENHAVFYQRLWQRSTVVDKSRTRMFDKTPRYLNALKSVVDRLDVPILVCYKDPRAIVVSDFKRALKGNKGLKFNAWYDDQLAAKKQYMRGLYRNAELARSGAIPNCLTVSLERLCLDTRRTINAAFDFVGAEFSLHYLNLKNLRYAHTKAPYIASNVPFEYFELLSAAQIKRIENDFQEFSSWFYS